MSTCTGCTQPATVQWQRAANPDEITVFDIHAQQGQAAIHAHQHHQATLHVVELRTQVEQVQARAKKNDPDAARILPAVRANLHAAEQVMTALAAAGPNVIPPADTVSIAVFACDVHAVDIDARLWLHQPGCLTDTPGICTCTQPAE